VATVFLGGILEGEDFLRSVGLLGAEDCDQSAGEDAHEVSESQVVAFTLGTLAQIVASELRLMLGGAEGGLEEGGA